MLKVKKLYPDVVEPKRSYPFDSGLDLCAYLPDGDITIKPSFLHHLDKPQCHREVIEVDNGYWVTEKYSTENLIVHSATVPIGLAIKLPSPRTFLDVEGKEETFIYEGQLRPRSGLSDKYAVTAHFGTIDNPYTGELKSILYNLSNKPFVVKHGMRICQLVISPVIIPAVKFVEDLGDTERGANGFGSTGLLAV